MILEANSVINVWAIRWKAACQGRWHYDKLYSLVKVLLGSNNPNISDYLAFTLLVSLTLFKCRLLGDVIWELGKALNLIATVTCALWFVALNDQHLNLMNEIPKPRPMNVRILLICSFHLIYIIEPIQNWILVMNSLDAVG